MRSIEDIRDTGAAWVTEPELAMLCAFAKRAEDSEAKLAKVVEALTEAYDVMVEAQNAAVPTQKWKSAVDHARKTLAAAMGE